MWYYVKDKKKCGPISDAAVQNLFDDGVIKKDTKVWTQGQKGWLPMDESVIYKKITSAPESNSLKILEFNTYILRAILVVTLFAIGVYSYMLFDAMEFLRGIFEDTTKLDNFATVIQLAEIQNQLPFAKRFLFLIFGVALFQTMRWMYFIAMTSKSVDNEFKYAPIFCACSFIIPILNLFLPVKMMWAALKASLYAIKSEASPFDYALFTTWWFFFVVTFILTILDFMTSAVGLENITVSIIFSLYILLMQFATIVLWICVISRIFKLQSSFFSRAENLRNKTAHIDARSFTV